MSAWLKDDISPTKSAAILAGFNPADARILSAAFVRLGILYQLQDDVLDLSVGLDRIARVGQALEPDVPLLSIHARDEESADRVEETIRNAFVFSEEPPEASPLLGSRIDSTS